MRKENIKKKFIEDLDRDCKIDMGIGEQRIDKIIDWIFENFTEKEEEIMLGGTDCYIPCNKCGKRFDAHHLIHDIGGKKYHTDCKPKEEVGEIEPNLVKCPDCTNAWYSDMTTDTCPFCGEWGHFIVYKKVKQ